jgi:multidrug efflux system membrane fusion protein
MRAIWSYGVALLIIIGIAVWMGTGTIVNGGNGPGNGERPAIALVEPEGGTLTEAVKNVSPDHSEKEAEAHEAAETIAERNDASGNGDSGAPRSVRIEASTAKLMPIDVPLRGKTEAKSQVAILAQTSGIINTVNVEKGQKVAAGDVLCELDRGSREAAVAQAKATLAQAQTAYDTTTALIKKGIAATNTVQAVEASLSAAKAGLQNAELELERTEIKTEIDGVVQGPIATVGSMLSAGQSCASVVQLDPMLFTASLSEAKMGYAKLGLPATVTTISGEKVEGKVTYIGSVADEATRSFPVEIQLSNPDGKVLSGTTAEAVVLVGTAPVHILPQSILTLDDSGVLGIRTVEGGDTVAFHPVDIIKDTRDGVWIVGLPPKINVITIGQEYVKQGQVVNARTVDGEAAS